MYKSNVLLIRLYKEPLQIIYEESLIVNEDLQGTRKILL